MTEEERQERPKRFRGGKKEYVQELANRAIDKYEQDNKGKTVERNSTPGNYAEFAKELNKFVNGLPEPDPDQSKKDAENVNGLPEHASEQIEKDADKRNSSPNKFEISNNTIRNAVYYGTKDPPKIFYEALHWYVHKKPSKNVEPVFEEKTDQLSLDELLLKQGAYENEIEDLNRQLVEAEGQITNANRQTSDAQQTIEHLNNQISAHESQAAEVNRQLIQAQNSEARWKQKSRTAWTIGAIFGIAFIVFAFKWLSANREATVAKHGFDSTTTMLETLKRDMRILPYQPTPAEIARLEGVYMVYTASPQARASDPDRYHKVVPNILVVTYKNGYFTFDRYGHDFDQKGFMQFERPGLVSMHSYMLDSSGKPSPKKSLLDIENGRDTFSVISTSWSFDSDPAYNISIGIREVFIKIGKPGSITQIVNSPRNFGKAGKLFDLKKANGQIETIYIQNIRLETLPTAIQSLVNEESILLKDPDASVILEKPVAK